MNKKNLLILFLITIGTSNFCCAQTYAYYKTRTYIKNYLWSPNLDMALSNVSFPAYDDMHGITNSFVTPSASKLSFVRNNNDSIPSSQILVFRCYADNVSSVEFTLINSKSQNWKRTVNFNYQGYQILHSLTFDSLILGKDQNISITVKFKGIDTTKSSRFILAEAWLGNDKIEQHLSPSKVFMAAPYSNNLIKNKGKLSHFESAGQYSHFPNLQYEEYYKSNVFIETHAGNSEKVLSTVFLSLLSTYPYYKERKINKQSVIKKAYALFQVNKSFCDNVAKINDFLKTEIKDPHFYLQSKCTPQTPKVLTSPIYCYNFNNKAIVSAILDSVLREKIPLGSEIVTINQDQITLNTRVTVDQVNELLKKAPGENIRLKFIYPDGTAGELEYTLKTKYAVAKKYTGNKSNSYSFLNDSTSYFKVSSINEQTIASFISSLDSINTRKNLILDFRNCGGGDFLAGAKLVSSIIKKPFKYFDFQDVSNGKLDSVVVAGQISPANFRSDGHIAFIINRGSACVTELLASCLKHEFSQFKIVGSEHSVGALAFTYQVVLPDEKASFTTNAITPGKILLNGKSIENTGITPDIYVRLEKFQDLAPYDDKVLQAAITGK